MEFIYELKNVSKIYWNGELEIRAVDEMSFQIKNGEFISIQGPSGSGKSTLLNLLGAIDVPTSGELWFVGKNFKSLRDNELSRIRLKNIGFVFQSYNLIPDLNVLENVEMPLKYAGVDKVERKRVAKKVLESVGLMDRLNHVPAQLSGGEEQRVAIARALINEPSVILADEPTGNLDAQNRDLVLDLLRELNSKGQTIIIVTHDPEVAKITQRKLVIRKGKLA
jgi:putative ABC transport system ATP-binding protein